MLSERLISGSCVRRPNPRLQATRKKPRAPEPERLGERIGADARAIIS